MIAKGIIRISSACIIGIILLLVCLLLLNLPQAAVSFLGPVDTKYILVDDFEDGILGDNNLGGAVSCWGENTGLITCPIRFEGNKGFLEMQYDVSMSSSAYALYSSELISLNLTALDSVWVSVKGEEGSEPLYIEFKDCGPPDASQFPKALISDYLPQGIITSEWRAVAIPLITAFDAITDWTCIERMNILAHNEIGSDQGTTYVDDIRLLPAKVLMDDFHNIKAENELGGTSGFWTTNDGAIAFSYPDNELKLDYDVTITTPTAEASYWTELRNTNLLLRKDALFFKIRGDEGSEEVAIEFKDCGLSGETQYPKIKVSDYLLAGITITQRNVAIPLAAFANGMDWACVETMNILVSAHPWFDSRQGTVYIDDIILAPTPHPVPLIIDRFDDCNNWNALTWVWSGDTNNLATIDFGPDEVHRYGNHGCGYQIAYDVNGNSSAWLLTELKGLDVTNYSHLRFRLKGAVGNEELHVYLRDSQGEERYYEDIRTTEDWQEILIPLDFFGAAVHLEDLAEFKIAFEWKTMSGEVYIDDISFIKPEIFLPIILKLENTQDPFCLDSPPSSTLPYINYEPNNKRCSAFGLSPGVPIESYICCPDDTNDYYFIDLNTLNPITVRLTNMPRGVDYDLYLYYGTEGRIIAKSDKYSNDDEEISYTPLQTGTYYIRIFPYSGHSLSPYTLQADFQ